jgi:hypothetical protein
MMCDVGIELAPSVAHAESTDPALILGHAPSLSMTEQNERLNMA